MPMKDLKNVFYTLWMSRRCPVNMMSWKNWSTGQLRVLVNIAGLICPVNITFSWHKVVRCSYKPSESHIYFVLVYFGFQFKSFVNFFIYIYWDVLWHLKKTNRRNIVKQKLCFLFHIYHFNTNIHWLTRNAWW